MSECVREREREGASKNVGMRSMFALLPPQQQIKM